MKGFEPAPHDTVDTMVDLYSGDGFPRRTILVVYAQGLGADR